MRYTLARCDGSLISHTIEKHYNRIQTPADDVGVLKITIITIEKQV
jgi:hypothetical protein